MWEGRGEPSPGKSPAPFHRSHRQSRPACPGHARTRPSAEAPLLLWTGLLLAARNTFHVPAKVSLYDLHKLRIELHTPKGVGLHDGNILGAGDVSRVKLRDGPHIQIDVAGLRIEKLFGLLRCNPFDLDRCTLCFLLDFHFHIVARDPNGKALHTLSGGWG